MNAVEEKIAMQLGVLQLQIAQLLAKLDAAEDEIAKLKAQATPATPKAINGEAHAGH